MDQYRHTNRRWLQCSVITTKTVQYLPLTSGTSREGGYGQLTYVAMEIPRPLDVALTVSVVRAMQGIYAVDW